MQPITVQYKSACGAMLYTKIYSPQQILSLDITKERCGGVRIEEITESDARDRICKRLMKLGVMEIPAEVADFDFYELTELYSALAISCAAGDEVTRNDYYKELGRIWCEKQQYSRVLFKPEEN